MGWKIQSATARALTCLSTFSVKTLIQISKIIATDFRTKHLSVVERDAAYWRGRAVECRRLAETATDRMTMKHLEDMADEFDEEARLIDESGVTVQDKS